MAMPRKHSRCCYLLAAAALAAATYCQTFKTLSFVVGTQLFGTGLQPRVQKFHRVALEAAGRVALADADAAKAVASALNGQKLSGKALATKAEDKTVVLDGLEGDFFGNVDIQGTLYGTAQGKAVVFDARKSGDATKAVAFIASNSIQGMFLVGTGGSKPNSDEISWASKVSSNKMSLDIEGPINSMGLPKRWIRNLLKAATPADAGFSLDAASAPVYAVGLFGIFLVVLLSGNTSSPSDFIV